jgi:hypothetical protein
MKRHAPGWQEVVLAFDSRQLGIESQIDAKTRKRFEKTPELLRGCVSGANTCLRIVEGSFRPGQRLISRPPRIGPTADAEPSRFDRKRKRVVLCRFIDDIIVLRVHKIHGI